MNKYIIFSHESDIDGLGSIILSKLAFPNLEYVLVPNVEKLEEIFRSRIKEKSLGQYKSIFITDLALYDPALTMVADSNLKEKVFVFDHHKRAIDDGMDRFPFTKITEKMKDIKTCGTQLFYNYLIEKNYLTSHESINQFVELTRLEDTWEWKNCGSIGEKAHDLAILFNVIGKEKYIQTMIGKLIYNSQSFEFTNEEKMLIENKKKEYDELLELLIKSSEVFIDEKKNEFCVAFADYEYRNELADYLKGKKKYEKIKYIIIIAINKGEYGQKSYRSIDDNFDVNEIAESHGGGGHPKAASVNITKEQKEHALILTKKESLKYLAESKFCE